MLTQAAGVSLAASTVIVDDVPSSGLSKAKPEHTPWQAEYKAPHDTHDVSHNVAADCRPRLLGSLLVPSLCSAHFSSLHTGTSESPICPVQFSPCPLLPRKCIAAN